MLPKLLISITDNDDSARDAVAGLVRSFNLIAVDFKSAGDFLESDVRLRTDCLISDVRMPGMSGIALFRFLNASDRPIPTILMTAFADEAAHQAALAAGVVCYLSKPLDADMLFDCIRMAIGGPAKSSN
ncbi:response regulator transcription factor [Sneathiella sp.]|uniref:response regulator transcription factor n=1 Tax=Sneathiella sp. TaxID=1964365 RepID=UPI003563A771